MAQRTPIVGGNWKMNTDRADATSLARAVAAGCMSELQDEANGESASECDVVIFPPYVWLTDVAAAAGAALAVGVQDISQFDAGAFTGEISTAMAGEAGASWTILGHSERRHVLGETDATIRAKLARTLETGMSAILCVGETEGEREAGETVNVVRRQLEAACDGLDAPDPARFVIAYEPVWAIGTGRSATAGDAQAVHAAIRTALGERYDAGLAAKVRLQYGGSVKPTNAADLIAEADIDGFLVGGASLVADDFLAIIRAAASVA